MSWVCVLAGSYSNRLFHVGDQGKVSPSSCQRASQLPPRLFPTPSHLRPFLRNARSAIAAVWHPPKAGCWAADDGRDNQAERKKEKEPRCPTSSQHCGRPQRNLRVNHRTSMYPAWKTQRQRRPSLVSINCIMVVNIYRNNNHWHASTKTERTWKVFPELLKGHPQAGVANGTGLSPLYRDNPIRQHNHSQLKE